MPYPPSKNRSTPSDPNSDHVAAELASLRKAMDNHHFRNNPGPETYVEHAVLTESKVKADIVRDRGAKHTRS